MLGAMQQSEDLTGIDRCLTTTQTIAPSVPVTGAEAAKCNATC
jgi:hypothetical protein